jgi:hypothetical protein
MFKKYILKSRIFPKALGYHFKKLCIALDGAGAIHNSSPHSRHVDDANDKFKIFYVNASVCPVGRHL